MSVTQMEPYKAWPIYKYILLLIILTLTILFHWVPLKTVQGVKRNHCLSTTRPFEDVVLGDLLDLEGASHSVFFFFPVVPFFLNYVYRGCRWVQLVLETRGIGTLELELQVAVSHLIQMLETEPESFARAVSPP